MCVFGTTELTANRRETDLTGCVRRFPSIHRFTPAF
jgi:hypothetical protein